MTRIHAYVGTVIALSIGALGAVAYWAPAPDMHAFAAVACFASLGVVAQSLSFQLSRTAAGAISFILFLAAVLVSPSWAAIAGVAASMVISELTTDKPWIKRSFNIAQHSLASALGLLAFLAVGGHAIRVEDSLGVSHVVLLLVYVVANSFLVSGAIAVSESGNVFEVWRRNTGPALAYDALSLPILYAFAWVYVRFGAAWASVLAVPLIGVRQLYNTNSQLERVNQEMLQLMVAAIEARDPYTSGHSRRVSHNAKVIARTLGIRGKHVDRIGVAALLHDVGKIHEVFAPILRKPDRLTPEERAIMETHPIKSAELAQNVSGLKDLIAPIRHHHENWDGSGYPDGIAGEDIPLASRIIMFADTVDAMTTDRPYRTALSEADVRAELARLRGKQFDPKICDILLASPILTTLVRANSTALTPAYPLPALGTKRHRLLIRA